MKKFKLKEIIAGFFLIACVPLGVALIPIVMALNIANDACKHIIDMVPGPND